MEETSTDKPKKLFVPVLSRKQKAKNKNPVAEAVELMRKAIEKDPVKDLIKMVQTEMEKARKHELKLMEILIATENSQNTMPNPPFNMHMTQPHITTP